MKKTRVLLIDGPDDFSVISFESAHGGTPVKDILDDLEKYESEDEEWYLEAFEFDGEIDPNFIKFVKSKIQDYDDSKNKNFFLETDIIPV
jgi:hypothetical protein